jgi:hypothetical protein
MASYAPARAQSSSIRLSPEQEKLGTGWNNFVRGGGG